MKRLIRILLTAILVIVATVLPTSSFAFEKAWYTPAELLTLLAERDGIRWAMPPTLAGRAFVGGELTTKEALDEACKQWKLEWMESNGVVVVHRPDDARLKQYSATLKSGGDGASNAAWDLGWLRDARAVPPLAEALASPEADIALAAAKALDTLTRDVPLGREERVDAMPKGRVSLAKAFPFPDGMPALLDSPYPPIRAAALRLLLSHGGKKADEALVKTAGDKSVLVREVRQHFLFTPPETPKPSSKWEVLVPLPKDPAEVKAECERMVGELPGLEKRSGWEEMQHRVRIMAGWSRSGSEPATDALIELCSTKIQHGWFPGFVQKELAATGSERVKAHLKAFMPKADRATLVRGLEQSFYGDELLAYTRPYLAEPTLCYVTARLACGEAYRDLLALAAKGDLAAIDAIGVIGGSHNAVSVLMAPLLQDESNTVMRAFRAAKALGTLGTSDAAAALRAATTLDSRLRRHAASLFLGRIGGPDAAERLRKILATDDDRFVRAAAAESLEQIGIPDDQIAVNEFRKSDAAPPVLTYRPRNARFGSDFPVNEWVNLKIRIEAFAEFGEMGWNYDAANKLFFRYGGCSGYTNELTVFDLGTEEFVQRRPNEEMAGWEDRRPPRGCSAGRTWDPYCKVAWIGPSIGGTAADLAIAEYYNKDGGYRFCSYDLATDRFQPAHLRQATYGEPAKRYAYDWKHGLMYPVKFQHREHITKDWWALDTKSADPYSVEAWLNKLNPEGDYPRFTGYTTAAVDQDAGLLVVYCPPAEDRAAETWTYDPEKNVWKSMSPKTQPADQPGAGLSYDPFHKVLLLQSGKKEYQFGGPGDSITWTYDVRTNTWTDLAPDGGPGNPWVGAVDFDPEHNAFVLFNHRDKSVWAYRHKTVPVGTTAK